ncbi:hypothetical protein DM02DRAFT_361442 [Periconia macrospinosa]|uniref:Chalcone isomerase domain-containing protein n=1 Tax=Periconia macrospinosa TaxID=97972 RepID=A0A2V1DTM2_9PLEO|nr:hypothetical protein DM02DRAFT_361442 [Periconia macrospinosa]
MIPFRVVARRPLFRCLNAPLAPPRPQHHPTRPYSEARYPQAARNPPRRLSDIDNASVHRAERIRVAQAKRRFNRAAFALVVCMAATYGYTFLIPTEELTRLQQEKEKAEGKPTESDDKKSRGVLDLISPRPTKTDSPRAAAEEFQGKKVLIAPGDKVIAAPPSAEHPTPSDVDTIELVETGTSYVPYFPRTITLPDAAGPENVETEAEYTLLGLGIRKVSFLRVQVYVVGLYVKNSSLHTLQNHLINTVNPTASALIPGEKEDLRKALLDPERSTQIWEAILNGKGIDAVETAFRVVPVRGTDFKHLQDGWMRGIASRTDEVRRKQAELLRQQAAEQKKIALPTPVDEGEFADESFGLAMKDFKGLFQGRGKAPKGSVLILRRDADGALTVMYQPITQTNKGERMEDVVMLGSVKDERVSRLVWLLYLGGQNVSSEDARKNIVDGCIGIVERPVGTIETMVQ